MVDPLRWGLAGRSVCSGSCIWSREIGSPVSFHSRNAAVAQSRRNYLQGNGRRTLDKVTPGMGIQCIERHEAEPQRLTRPFGGCGTDPHAGCQEFPAKLTRALRNFGAAVGRAFVWFFGGVAYRLTIGRRCRTIRPVNDRGTARQMVNDRQTHPNSLLCFTLSRCRRCR